jgi:AraC family transcriptional regulator
MDWITGIQRAIDYIEENITGELSYEAIARESFSSSFHFQRCFSILCGYTLGEYIRFRRLTLAGAELANTAERVIDVAYKYGYENPESFAKAFQKFHGITPTQARNGAVLKSFSRLSIRVSLEGGSFMNYRMEEKPEFLLTGYKRRFTGSPNDKRDQDHNFACETRLEQYILEGMCREHETIYQILTNFEGDEYDFYYAYRFPKWALDDIKDLPEDIAARFEHVQIPAGVYLVCETERCQFPTARVDQLRKTAVSEWLPTSGYELRSAPEIGVIHWFWEEGNDQLNNSRYCELWLPIAKK